MEKIYQLFLQYPQLCTDSRNIIPDSIFVCLKGENFDGNQFALQALEKGAQYVITEDISLSNHPQCIVVSNSLETLQKLSLYHRKQLSIPVIGITGTNGKTTTKELLSSILSKKYKVAFTKGNLNNHIGVPLTLLSIKSTDEMAIIEMGANHPGEIAQLCDLSLPNFGVITNIGKAHIEGFGSIENIITTKKALYKSVIHNKGTLFVNAEDPIITQHLDYDKVIFYGINTNKGITGSITKMAPCLTIKIFDQEIETHLTGNYNLLNIICAATIGHYFGVSQHDIIEAISHYIPSNNRSQIIQKERKIIIADYYNANPTSMDAALHNLNQIMYPCKIAILGDMLELGEVSKIEHAQVIQLCKKLAIQTYFIGNEFFKQHYSKENCFLDVDDFNAQLSQTNFDNTMILIKGSRGIHLENLFLLK